MHYICRNISKYEEILIVDDHILVEPSDTLRGLDNTYIPASCTEFCGTEGG